MKKTDIFKIIIFLLVLGLLFAFLTGVFQRKTLAGQWCHTKIFNSYRNLEKNSLDVLIFGSSHAYCSFMPTLMQEKYGISAYVLATNEQPITATYFMLKEALKTQSPHTVVIESFMVNKSGECPEDSAIYNSIDVLPFSINKLEMISALTKNKESKVPYYLTLFNYHTRWGELETEDFKHDSASDTHADCGYVRLEGVGEVYNITITAPDAVAEIQPDEEEYLRKMAELCREKGIDLIFANAPFSMNDSEYADCNAVRKLANEEGVVFAECAKDYAAIGIDKNTDFYDGSHLNESGAAKFTDYFTKNYLLSR